MDLKKFNESSDLNTSFNTSHREKLTIKPNDIIIHLYENIPCISYKYTGFIEGESEIVLKCIPKYRISPYCEVDYDNNTKKYRIILSGPRLNGNYLVTYQIGTITVIYPWYVMAIERFNNYISSLFC